MQSIKVISKIFFTKNSRDVTFEGQGHMISRSLLLILLLLLLLIVAYVRMHLCAKFDANRTIRLRVIQMAPNVTADRVTDCYTHQVITIPSTTLIFIDILR